MVVVGGFDLAAEGKKVYWDERKRKVTCADMTIFLNMQHLFIPLFFHRMT